MQRLRPESHRMKFQTDDKRKMRVSPWSPFKYMSIKEPKGRRHMELRWSRRSHSTKICMTRQRSSAFTWLMAQDNDADAAGMLLLFLLLLLEPLVPLGREWQLRLAAQSAGKGASPMLHNGKRSGSCSGDWAPLHSGSPGGGCFFVL